MSLNIGEKAIICRKYDTILTGIKPISAFMRHPYYPNLINFDSNYKTDEENKHIENIKNISIELAGRLEEDPEEIAQYIINPDFVPELTTQNRTVNGKRCSLEDTILYRNVSELITIDEKPTINGFYRLSQCHLLHLSNNLLYLAEKTIFIPINIYNLLEYAIKRTIGREQINGNLAALMLSEIKRRNFELETEQISSNFYKKEDLDTYMNIKFDNYTNNWAYKGIIKLDNRKYDIEQKSPETLVKTLYSL